jgi:hypothetical protein
MKRIITLIVIVLISTTYVLAQQRKITGKIIDSDTKEAIMQTTVQLLKNDSSYVGGGVTTEEGVFSVSAPQNGKYLLKISNVGYPTLYKRLSVIGDKDTNMGTIVYKAKTIMLKGATVTAHLAKVQVQKDTFVYNADAYRTPEGSAIEELVKKLPGAQVGDDGTITINGKEVKKILVDGKEFFTGDTKTAMKNLPTSMIEKIKAYDEKSDMAKVTGIDDGNEQTVLDFGVKKGMKKGFFVNADVSAGTNDRYSEKLMGAKMDNNMRYMGLMNANNTNDKGFPGGGRGGSFGGNNTGLNASKMLGLNLNYDNGTTFSINGGLRWNHSDGDQQTKTSSENFVNTTGAFSNSLSQQYSRGNNWNFNARLEWKPDTMTNILFRPTFGYSTSDSRNVSSSASYNADPYLYVTDPLSVDAIKQLASDSLMVNTKYNNSLSYSDSKKVNATLQINRRLNNRGRSITLVAGGGYSSSNSKSLSASSVTLYQIKNALGTDSVYQTDRYNVTPTKNWNYSLKGTWSEPLAKSVFLQASYQYQYNYSKSDRTTYDFSDLSGISFQDIVPSYRGWDSYFSRFVTSSNPIENYEDESLSRYSEYKNYIQDIELMLRVIKPNYNFNIGVQLEPQKTHFIQDYQNVHSDTIRNVTNFTPTLDFRYKFSDRSQLRINYRGSSSQPSMTDLMDITDDSDPLNITKGNPGLKPSFTNEFRLFYNNYIVNHQKSIMAHISFNTTRNSISDEVTYNATTGGKITKPQNINGNWNAFGMLMFNSSIDSAGYFNVNTFTTLNYKNQVAYLYQQQLLASTENTTRSTSVSERLSVSYRNDWIEIEPNGSVDFTHARNDLQSTGNLDTWQFAYGMNLTLYAPWGTSLSTDVHENSRRGFSDASMNTNEFIWNAQVSQSFLKGKTLTVSLQLFDILHNQSNFSRTISAMMRSDTQSNNINSYGMLHVIYRINMFGGKNARQGMHDGPDDRRSFGGRDGAPGMGGPGGGFGGGGNHGGGGGFGGPMM